jgi:hypothetical protein
VLLNPPLRQAAKRCLQAIGHPKMRNYFFIFIILLFANCNNSATQETILKSDTLKINADTSIQKRGTIEDWEEKGNKLRDTNYKYLDKLLTKVLKIAESHKTDKLYLGIIDTSFYHFKNMNATFQVGNIFSSDKKHLLVRRFINEYEGYETSLFSEIYILKGNHFEKLVSDTADIGYSQDTLKDINLDGYKDYVISQYSGAGCCPRDDRIAYLYDNKNGAFEPVAFFNPDFDNKNKIIYEMDYGHPGEVSIEKYIWRGLTKIKIESIRPTHFQNRIDSIEKPYTFTKTIYPSEKIVIIKEVPLEYKKTKNFEYFISYQD